MTAFAAFYTCGAEIACPAWNCGATSALQVYWHCSCKGLAGLVMLQGVPSANFSKDYFCTHRLARGAGEVEAS